MRRLLVVAIAALGIASSVASAAPPSADVRFATFNASLNRATAGELLAHQLLSAGVFWPLRSDPLFRLTGVFDSLTWGAVGGFPTSDHRSVWIDVSVQSVK